ncbi:MAG: hypothetical protein KGJ07_02465 [Patescibacteria group bacterium]|nr:hypothetical protein [Patescibacteria group bacterium]MDE2589662.1 hypothetical protein [Patescibacteria group bacterium]
MRNPELEARVSQKESAGEDSGEAKRRKVADTKSGESGYSEEQQALDIEARSGDLYALKKSKGFQQMKGSAKVLAAYQTVSVQLGKLIETYTQLVESDLHRAQKMLAEIKKIRAMQKMLLTRLFGTLEENGDIDLQELEKELKEFLE